MNGRIGEGSVLPFCLLDPHEMSYPCHVEAPVRLGEWEEAGIKDAACMVKG